MIGYAGQRGGITRMAIPLDGTLYLLEERQDIEGLSRVVHLKPVFTVNGLDEVRVDGRGAVEVVEKLKQLDGAYNTVDGEIPPEGRVALDRIFSDAERLFENYFRWHRGKRVHV